MDPTTELILNDRKIASALTDRNLNIREISGAIALFGQNGGPYLGRSLLEIVPELIGSEDALTDILDGRLSRLELAWVNRETKIGQTIYLVITILPYRDRSGAITGLLHLAQDMTELGNLEQQVMQSRNELLLLKTKLTQQNLALSAANTELRRLGEIKSNFVSTAAHELRSPLASIIGFTELLIDQEFGALNDQQLDALYIVQQNGKRQLDITNNLLDVTRIETGYIDLLLQPESLTALVETIAAELHPQLQDKEQHLTLRATPNLPLALLDNTRAKQIVSNLLNNAIKYTPQGGTIIVNIAPAQAEGFLQVTIADTGMGITKKDQEKLFSRFFRGENATDNSIQGTGLGLHITRSLVELHGGKIWFESELNQGSIFSVTFPVADDCP